LFFYSPKIVYGLDFNNIDNPQDVFIYIKGSTISPSESFQQATRCRNIKTLYFYGVDENSFVENKTLEAVKEHYKYNLHLLKHNRDIFQYTDNKDNIAYSHNLSPSFFKLFCYNQYIKNVYNSNKVKHFIKILEDLGFNVEIIGEANTISKTQAKRMNKELKVYDDNFINEYIKADDKDDEKYSDIHDKTTFLNLIDVKYIEQYRKELNCDEDFNEHNTVIKLLRTDEYIDRKLSELEDASYDINIMQSDWFKIKLVRKLEKLYKIDITNGIINNDGAEIEMDDNFHNIIAKTIKTTKSKPTNKTELIQLYIGMIKHITNNSIVKTTKINKRCKDRGKYIYTLNEEYLTRHLSLNKIKNRKLSDIDIRFINASNVRADEVTIDFIDD